MVIGYRVPGCGRNYESSARYPAAVRYLRLLIGISLIIAFALASVTAFAHGDDDPTDVVDDHPIVVVEVSDPIDQRIIDYVVEALRADEVHAFILKIDSPGASSGDIGAMYEAVLAANAPVISWIGPNPAVAYGGAAFLANHADLRSAAPGASVGHLSPAVQRSGEESPSVRPGDDPGAVAATIGVLADATVTVSIDQPTVEGFVDRLDPALGQLIVSLDGLTVERGGQSFTLSTATTETIDGQEFVVASRNVTFVKAGLIDRFLRLGSRPETAFLFLVFALAFAVFEFYAAGSGLMAFVAGFSMILAGYGLATLPMWWPAVAMVLAGVAFLVWGFIQNRVGWRAVVGTLLVLAGGLTFTTSRPAYPPAIWLVVVATASIVVFIWYSLTTVVRARFATPTFGREYMLGTRCVTVSELTPLGVVLVSGARWRATADRGVEIAAGVPVEIVGITGLLLEVDPVVTTSVTE
jgi:membrane-bound serine protease (ClpP class)